MRTGIFVTIVSAVLLTPVMTFAQRASAPLNETDINTLISGLNTYTFNPSPSVAEERSIKNLLELGRSAIVTQESVNYFNKKYDLAVIGKLVDLSTLNLADVRINATRILADVTENRSVCVVLDRLLEKDVSPTARFNLFQVVRVVSLRMKYADVAEWIQQTIDANEFASLDPTGENVPRIDKTGSLLRDISRTIRSKRNEINSTLRQDEPRFYQGCVALKNIQAFSRPPT